MKLVMNATSILSERDQETDYLSMFPKICHSGFKQTQHFCTVQTPSVKSCQKLTDPIVAYDNQISFCSSTDDIGSNGFV